MGERESLNVTSTVSGILEVTVARTTTAGPRVGLDRGSALPVATRLEPAIFPQIGVDIVDRRIECDDGHPLPGRWTQSRLRRIKESPSQVSIPRRDQEMIDCCRVHAQSARSGIWSANEGM